MSLPKDYDKNYRKNSSPHIKDKGFAYTVIIVLVIGVIATGVAVAWMSNDNSRSANNSEWRQMMDNAYRDCNTKIQAEACMRDVDEIFDKYCRSFDSC